MSKTYEYTVVSTEMTDETTLMLRLHTAKQRRSLTYEPGQYAAISFMNRNRPTPVRCFSITSSPTEQGELGFGIRIKGNYTKTAADSLIVGSKVIVEGPFGNFIYSAERDRSAVMLAGGIGITPFLSMLHYASRLQLENDITLLYSCHSQDDIPFLDELIRLDRANKHLYIVFVVGSGPVDRLKGLQVIQGRITRELIDYVTVQSYVRRTFFICGPPGFTTGMSTILSSRGVLPDSIITEGFTQGQKSAKELRHNLPLQVYALTGLSLLFGSATIMTRDVAQVSPKNVAAYAAQNQAAVTGNSRQSSVDQTLSELQSNNGAGGQSVTSGQTTQSSGQGGQGSSSGSTVKSGNQSKSQTSATTGSGKPSGGSTSSGSSSGSSGSTPAPAPAPAPKPSPAPAPPPAPTPVAPSLSFGVSPSTITSGKSATLSWGINANATAPVGCNASGGWSGAKASSGSQTVNPTSSTTFNLVCSNSAGSSSRSVTLTVVPACVSTPSNPC